MIAKQLTGLCIYCIFYHHFRVYSFKNAFFGKSFLEKKIFTVKQYAMLRRQQSHTFHLPHLDLTLGCFVQQHAAKACSLGAIGIQHTLGV